MTGSPRKERRTVTWVLKSLLGLAFLVIGTVKLTGSLRTAQMFANIGWGQWFRYATGLLDVLGAVLLFVPRWTFFGALVITGTIGLASALTLAHRIHDSLAPPLVLTALAATLAWLTRPGTASPPASKTRAADD